MIFQTHPINFIQNCCIITYIYIHIYKCIYIYIYAYLYSLYIGPTIVESTKIFIQNELSKLSDKFHTKFLKYVQYDPDTIKETYYLLRQAYLQVYIHIHLYTYILLYTYIYVYRYN
jgi:hypothetical protein